MARKKTPDHGDALRALMLEHKLSDKAVADMLEDVSARGVRAWRQRANPTPRWAITILKLRLGKKNNNSR